MKIVLFDGFCYLCNSAVTTIIKHDKMKVIHFASQQSAVGKQLMIQNRVTPMANSVVYIADGVVFYKSDAMIEIAKSIQGWPSLFRIAIVFPRYMRDFIYNIVAKYRYKVFGKKLECSMPSAVNQDRFMS